MPLCLLYGHETKTSLETEYKQIYEIHRIQMVITLRWKIELHRGKDRKCALDTW